MLDYYSDCPTYALAFSPLDTPAASSSSSFRMAVGSYVQDGSATSTGNNITIIELDSSAVGAGQSDSDDEDEGMPDDDGDDNDDDELDSDDDPSRLKSSHEDGERAQWRRRRRRQHRRPTSAFTVSARVSHPYPPSAVAFSPARLSATLQQSSNAADGGGTREMVASSSECLRLWDLVSGAASEDSTGTAAATAAGFVNAKGRAAAAGPHSTLVQRAILANAKADYSAPLTAFSWSQLEPTRIVTSSIDTTCTVWDISTGVPVTQLIAHDREVYDVAWSPSSRDVFASVGADGSVRMFDLRSLEHSTILYEAAPPPSPAQNGTGTGTGASPKSTSSTSAGASASTSTPPPVPLLRLAFSPTAPTYLSVCHADASDVQILDTRSPGVPAYEVRGHGAPVNGMAWGGQTMRATAGGGGGESSGPGWLATCGDDSLLLLYDLTTTPPNPAPSSRSGQPAQPKIITQPSLSWTSREREVNAVAWRSTGSSGAGGGDGGGGGGGGTWGGEWVAAGCGDVVRCLRV